MSMTVKRTADTAQSHPIVHKIADIPGGVSVKTSVLGGEFLAEGTPIGAASSGICSVCKYAKMVTEAADNATAYEVEKGHHFKVGDYVMSAAGAKAYAITAIDKTSSTTKDTITIGTTLGVVVAVGAYLYEAAAQSTTTTSALKVAAKAIVGTGQVVDTISNISTDAILIGVTAGNDLPSLLAATLTGIINY